MPLLSGFHELFLKHYLLNLGVTPNLEYKDLLINKRVLTSSFNQVFNDFHSKTQLSPLKESYNYLPSLIISYYINIPPNSGSMYRRSFIFSTATRTCLTDNLNRKLFESTGFNLPIVCKWFLQIYNDLQMM